jgi:hypothetical protein
MVRRVEAEVSRDPFSPPGIFREKGLEVDGSTHIADVVHEGKLPNSCTGAEGFHAKRSNSSRYKFGTHLDALEKNLK